MGMKIMHKKIKLGKYRKTSENSDFQSEIQFNLDNRKYVIIINLGLRLF
tara:strand:+ start:1555 stop:1701 length:147 start_codon:yes stop_codon:yes gene_type:complete